jgi:predicted RecB family nuclease
MQNQAAEAAHSLSGALGISEDEANKLANAGMNSIEVIQLAGAEDIAEALGADAATGERILAAAQALQKA